MQTIVYKIIRAQSTDGTALHALANFGGANGSRKLNRS